MESFWLPAKGSCHKVWKDYYSSVTTRWRRTQFPFLTRLTHSSAGYLSSSIGNQHGRASGRFAAERGRWVVQSGENIWRLIDPKHYRRTRGEQEKCRRPFAAPLGERSYPSFTRWDISWELGLACVFGYSPFGRLPQTAMPAPAKAQNFGSSSKANPASKRSADKAPAAMTLSRICSPVS
jgi:hypothetical protein